MRQNRKFLFIAALTLVLLSAAASGAFAAADPYPIPVFVNGILLECVQPSFVEDTGVYVPLRALTEMMGYNVSYDIETKTAVFANSDTSLAVALSSAEAAGETAVGKVAVNGVDSGEAECRLINGSLLVPQSFITDYINRAALLVPEYQTVGDNTTPVSALRIFSADSVKSPSGLLIHSLTYKYSGQLADNEHEVASQYTLPQLAGFGDKSFETSLNQTFSDMFNATERNVLNAYKEISEAIAAGGEGYTYTEDMAYSFQYGNNGLFTLLLNEYSYGGGAHGSDLLYDYVIDQAASERLNLEDIFKPEVNFREILAAEMNKIRTAGTEAWAAVNEITTADLDSYDGHNFYYSDSDLVIYYDPYAIAPYATGLVEFRIPTETLAAHLLEKYAG
jgi:hypothetical protein